MSLSSVELGIKMKKEVLEKIKKRECVVGVVGLGYVGLPLAVEKAKDKGLVVSACHQNRLNKSIQKIREAVGKNRFGKMLYGTAHIRWNRGTSTTTKLLGEAPGSRGQVRQCH